MTDVAATQGGEQPAGAPTMGDRAMYFGRQLMMYYLVSNLVTGMLGGNKGASTGSQRAGVSGDPAIQRMALPMWDRGESMDMYAYVTYAPTFDAFGDHTKLIAHDAEIRIGCHPYASATAWTPAALLPTLTPATIDPADALMIEDWADWCDDVFARHAEHHAEESIASSAQQAGAITDTRYLDEVNAAA